MSTKLIGGTKNPCKMCGEHSAIFIQAIGSRPKNRKFCSNKCAKEFKQSKGKK